MWLRLAVAAGVVGRAMVFRTALASPSAQLDLARRRPPRAGGAGCETTTLHVRLSASNVCCLRHHLTGRER